MSGRGWLVVASVVVSLVTLGSCVGDDPAPPTGTPQEAAPSVGREVGCLDAAGVVDESLRLADAGCVTSLWTNDAIDGAAAANDCAQLATIADFYAANPGLPHDGPLSAYARWQADHTCPASTVEPTLAPPAAIHYRSCAEALDAGDAPLKRGRDAGYRRGLDRDGDGWACDG